MDIFFKWFAIFSGSSAGVLAVLLPLAALVYLAMQIYAQVLAWRLRRIASRYEEKTINEMQDTEEPPTEGGTQPWV